MTLTLTPEVGLIQWSAQQEICRKKKLVTYLQLSQVFTFTIYHTTHITKPKTNQSIYAR